MSTLSIIDSSFQELLYYHIIVTSSCKLLLCYKYYCICYCFLCHPGYDNKDEQGSLCSWIVIYIHRPYQAISELQKRAKRDLTRSRKLAVKTHFNINGFTQRIVFTQIKRATQKWPTVKRHSNLTFWISLRRLRMINSSLSFADGLNLRLIFTSTTTQPESSVTKLREKQFPCSKSDSFLMKPSYRTCLVSVLTKTI